MKSSLRILVSAAIALVVICTGCVQQNLSPIGTLVQSNKQRVATPVGNPSDLATLVAGDNAFAFDIYKTLLKGGGDNLFYSPYSISLALAMTYAGARSDTAKEMANTLHFTLPQERLHPALNGLDLTLSQRGKGAKGKDDKGFRLNIVNAIWGQKNYTFLTEFLDTLAENYGAGLRLLDFIAAPEPSRITINNWVSDQTEGKIKDLISQGAIDAMTRLILTNAIYFNAAWQYPFNKNSTNNGEFHVLGGGTTSVPMMHETASLRYAEGNNYQVVELPYDGRELSMLILLPKPDQFTAFEKLIDVSRANDIISALQYKQIALTMPKFKFTSAFNLKKTLEAMGMPVAFTDAANFSGMTGKRDLYISEVIHKAFVSVDEAGTEAAAATAVIMTTTSMPAQPTEVTIDRPFIFLIRDNDTGTILFMGRVLNPAQ